MKLKVFNGGATPTTIDIICTWSDDIDDVISDQVGPCGPFKYWETECCGAWHREMDITSDRLGPTKTVTCGVCGAVWHHDNP